MEQFFRLNKQVRIRVLLADDDPAYHAMMRKALNQSPVKLRIHSVYNGLQLLDYLSMHNMKSKKTPDLPDLIITDIYMPFIGGIHVLKKIRGEEQFRTIPIYVFSSNYDTTIRSSVMENGAIEFHRKPGDFNELQKIIDTILTNRGGKVQVFS